MAGWKTEGTPECFLKNGEPVTSPREMAELQMNSFRDKVKGLLDKLPDPTEDTTDSSRQLLRDGRAGHQ